MTAKLPLDVIFSRIMVTDTCWLWMSTRRTYRYGQVWGDYAHRWAYEYWIGPIPEGAWILHSCDTPLCVNPDHLRPGDHQENMDDMRYRGRNNKLKLTPEQILAIWEEVRHSGRSQTAIATDYGIVQTTVSMIKRRKFHRHLLPPEEEELAPTRKHEFLPPS